MLESRVRRRTLEARVLLDRPLDLDRDPSLHRQREGGAEKAHSRQRRWCLWSKPVNLGTWGLVPDPIAVAHAFVELGYGTVIHTRENGFKCGHIFAQTL